MRRAAALAALAFALSACSGQEVTPAERDRVERQLTSSQSPLGMPLQKEQAACVANVYLTADFSAETRDSILRGEPIAPRTSQDQETLNDITERIADECLGG